MGKLAHQALARLGEVGVDLGLVVQGLGQKRGGALELAHFARALGRHGGVAGGDDLPGARRCGAVDALVLTVEVAEQARLVVRELGAHGIELGERGGVAHRAGAGPLALSHAAQGDVEFLAVLPHGGEDILDPRSDFLALALEQLCVRAFDRLHGRAEVGDLPIRPLAAQDALDIPVAPSWVAR